MRSPSWFLRAPVQGKVRARLLCFPSAGGGTTMYRPWANELPGIEVCTVQLPGRERRLGEPALRRIEPLIDAIAPAAQAVIADGLPYALFGHSMGAIIAFELARRLAADGSPAPRRLFLSSFRAPHLPSRDPDEAKLTDDAMIEYLRGLAGTPPELLADRDFLDLTLPTLRADFALCFAYRFNPGPAVTSQAIVLSGSDDGEVQRDELDAWAEHLPGVRFARFPGGHFYLHDVRGAVLRLVADELR